jgi:phospholipid-binding lipoprotein MlaA
MKANKLPTAARVGFWLSALALVTLTGCATMQNPDPLEPLNRRTFAVNEAVDSAVVKPAVRIYTRAVPEPVRTGVTNFFGNMQDVWSAANLFLQGRLAEGVSDVMRVSTNTVFGVLGVFDVATELGMEKHGEDFGQTLGYWGMGQGAYIVWPLLGPSSLRDSLGMSLDMTMSPLSQVGDVSLRNSLSVLQLGNTRANLLPATDLIDKVALDKYLFIREAYLQRRSSQSRSGGVDEIPSIGADQAEPGPDNADRTTAGAMSSDLHDLPPITKP